jgi:hypothetical protein
MIISRVNIESVYFHLNDGWDHERHIKIHPLVHFFANDVVLNYKSSIRVDHKLKLWKYTLELKGFRLSRTKIKYMNCQFNGDSSDDGDVSLNGQVVPMNNTFWYLRSMLQSDEGIY